MKMAMDGVLAEFIGSRLSNHRATDQRLVLLYKSASSVGEEPIAIHPEKGQ